jgi:hypothetical protein
MMSDSQKPVALSITSAALLSVSQGAVGCGLGLLLAGKINERKRNVAAIGLLSLALGATITASAGLLTNLVSGPRSRLGARRRLRSIREGAGMHADEEVF